MKYTIKYKINQYKIYDEADRPVGIVRRPLLTGNRLQVLDLEGSTKYFVIRAQGKILIKAIGKGEQECQLEYSNETKKGINMRPPMAEGTVLDTDFGKIVIHQERKRVFFVQLNGKEIGKMTRMQCFVKQAVLSDEIPREYCGLLFAVTFLMLHEDDIELV